MLRYRHTLAVHRQAIAELLRLARVAHVATRTSHRLRNRERELLRDTLMAGGIREVGCNACGLPVLVARLDHTTMTRTEWPSLPPAGRGRKQASTPRGGPAPSHGIRSPIF